MQLQARMSQQQKTSSSSTTQASTLATREDVMARILPTVDDDDHEADEAAKAEYRRNEAELKTALGALGIEDDDDERQDVALEDIVAGLKARDPGSSVLAEVQGNAIEEVEALTVLAYVQDGLEKDNSFPKTAWLVRWGLKDLLHSLPNTDPSAHQLVETDFLPPLKFRQLWQAAVQGECDEWELEGPRYMVALIILLDRFSRLFSASERDAFAHDATALSLAEAVLESDEDHNSLTAIEKLFLYMPLMHSENASVQSKSVKLLADLVAKYPSMYSGLFGKVHELALRNRDILKRFKRYPQRNRVLGRKNTKEEEQFLASSSTGSCK